MQTNQEIETKKQVKPKIFRYFIIFIVVYVFMYSNICFANSCEHTNTSFLCVKYISNYDGDTITVDIPNVHPFFGYHAHIRIYGIDTPEIDSKVFCEKKVAEYAKNRLALILLSAKKIDLLDIGTEKYGRILARIVVNDTIDVGKTLLNEKLAYEYYGEKKSKFDWCTYFKKK